MSYSGSVARGTNFDSAQFTLSGSTQDITCTCGGNVVGWDLVSDGGGKYHVHIDAVGVRCPGPIRIFDKGTKILCYSITGCP